MRVLTALLLPWLSCGGVESEAVDAGCDDIGAAVAERCPDFDDALCIAFCEEQDHAQSRLDDALTCIRDTLDCGEATTCLDDEAICPTG